MPRELILERSTRLAARQAHDWLRKVARASRSSSAEEHDEIAAAIVDELGTDDADWLAAQLGMLEWSIGATLRMRRLKLEPPKYPERSDRTSEEFHTATACYRLEFRSCGKARCKCAGGDWHGPYWYAYRRDGPKVRKEYIGKTLSGVDATARRRAEDRWVGVAPTAAAKAKPKPKRRARKPKR